MLDWNAVVTLYQGGFRYGVRILREFGAVEPTDYHNVVVMTVRDPGAFLCALEERVAKDPRLYDAISRAAPAICCFAFHSPEELEKEAEMVISKWLPRLLGRSFHVRLHRRGHKTGLRSPDIEKHLGTNILTRLEQLGAPGSLEFQDPDTVIAIDTIDERAGMSIWSREELERFKLLRPD